MFFARILKEWASFPHKAKNLETQKLFGCYFVGLMNLGSTTETGAQCVINRITTRKREWLNKWRQEGGVIRNQGRKIRLWILKMDLMQGFGSLFSQTAMFLLNVIRFLLIPKINREKTCKWIKFMQNRKKTEKVCFLFSFEPTITRGFYGFLSYGARRTAEMGKVEQTWLRRHCML